MPAVVRVKRRIDEEPLSAFVLNAKKRRVDVEDVNNSVASENAGPSTNNKQEITTLLKFAGTIKEQNDDKAITEYAKFSKVEARNIVGRKSKQPINLTDKARQEMRKHVQEQRFRVVNCMRTTLNAADTVGSECENHPTKELTIVDIEKQQQSDSTVKLLNNSVTATNTAAYNQHEQQPSTSAAALADNVQQQCTAVDSDDGYVYDLYFPENETFSTTDSVDLLEDYHLSCYSFDYQFAWMDYQTNDNEIDDDVDSEDSNHEDYFTNDYPDEDEIEFDHVNDTEDVDDEDDAALRRAVEKFIFDDDEEEDYNIEERKAVYCDNIDNSDDGDNDFEDYSDTASDFCSDVDKSDDET